jgi:hypothetical protein
MMVLKETVNKFGSSHFTICISTSTGIRLCRYYVQMQIISVKLAYNEIPKDLTS